MKLTLHSARTAVVTASQMFGHYQISPNAIYHHVIPTLYIPYKHENWKE